MKTSFPYTRELKQLSNTLLQKGDELRLVGGCVRNFLMQKPITDYDLACKYKPEKTMEILQKAKIRVIPTGIKHGTVTARINDISFEITTLRRDIAPDGRHSKIEFTDDYLEDAKRRDFTINALYLDFNGKIYDYFDGIKDIKTGIIRFIGNAEDRIKEDHLRILRFFRFFCSYGFTLDKDGLQACVKHKEKIKNLSSERIKTEIFKILESPYPVQTLKIMQDNNILQQITNNIEFNFQNLELFCSIKQKLDLKENSILNLAILLKERSTHKQDLDYIKENWKLTNKEYKKLLFLLNNNFKKCTEEEIKRILFKFPRDKKAIINLFTLDCILKKDTKIEIDFIKKSLSFIKNYEIPTLPITGLDLIKMGFKEGKPLGEALKKAEQIFIDSNYKLNKNQMILMFKK